MKVTVQGQGDVSLTQTHYVASGGEGQIFAIGNTAYKVYHDPTKMLAPGKISELSVLTHPNINRPDRILIDPRNQKPIGYTTRFIRDAMPLCAIFTRAFREREGLDHPRMLALVQKLQELVEHTHQKGILVVDLNEMNYLVDNALDDVFAIDVDSYQTPHYRATAIMPSVKDWTVQHNDFTEGSDWFSFACVAFQMFVGIHPYKGRHPAVTGLDERMRQNVSVFAANVSVPKVVYPFSVIPSGYLAWFEAVLRDGKRFAPPADAQAVVAPVQARQISSGASLDITILTSFRSNILGYAQHGDKVVVWTSDGAFINDRRVGEGKDVRAVGFSPTHNKPVFASIENQRLVVRDETGRSAGLTALRADEAVASDGRIYVRSGENIVQVTLSEMGPSAVVTAFAKTVVNVLEHATRLFEGVVIQNLLGSVFVSVLEADGAHQRRVPELDGYKVLDAKCSKGILMVVGAKGGKYDRLVFKISATGYDVLPAAKDITPSGLNFIVLDNGMLVHLTEDDRLVVTAGSKQRVVEADVLGGDMRLVKHNGRVAFVRRNELYKMSLK